MRQKFLKIKNLIFLTATLFLMGITFRYADWTYLKAHAEERYTELQTFSKVLNLVEQYYVEKVDTKKLIYGAIKGMLRELDPHTNFLPPDIFKDFETETSGEFGGLGIEISIQNGILTIISPIEDTPAFEAGIKPGDKVVAVNGKSTKGLSLVEASQLMKGKTGVKIILSVVRESLDEPIDITITRAQIKIKSVKSTELDEGYGYVKITSFIENTGRDLEKVLGELKKKNTAIKGLILDLRRNPGGLLDQAVKVSDLFLKKGIIVSTKSRDQSKEEVIKASEKGPFTDFPVIVLINEYSASASEIVSGALQDNKRAIIMGEKSFGKGSVQSVIRLGDGSGLKLTVARYFTPSGRSIQSEGITPDILLDEVDWEAFGKAVIKSKSPREKDIEGHLLSDRERKDKEKSDKSKDSDRLFWWKEMGSKKEFKTAKDKLLAQDYQVFHAFNYLKAWKLMKEVQ